MDNELKNFIEDNFDFLVKLYNRYIRYILRESSVIEYYASPYMNLLGYPSSKFITFCIKYYNKKYNRNILIKHEKSSAINNLYLYIKLLIIFIFSGMFFSKRIKRNSIVIHGFHSDDNFNYKPYKTIKTPPFESFHNKIIYHDINISFISLKSLFKYKKNNIICSIRYINLFEFIHIHYIALKIFIKSKKINLFPVSFVHIIYTLVKGISISNLINNLDNKSKYLQMYENRGYNLITDYLIQDKNKSIFLDLGIMFRLSPEYMMFNYKRHTLKCKFLFMSEFNYELIKNKLGNIDYELFKNYRIDCKSYNNESKKNSILLISPLSLEVSESLYKLILDNKNEKLNIKIRLHPYLNRKSFDTKYIEYRNIYELLDDYDTIIYSGITTASIELYFQGKKVYKYISNEFIDIDPLTDKNLVKKIKSLSDIGDNVKIYTKEEKAYYLGCDNKNLKEILKEIEQ